MAEKDYHTDNKSFQVYKNWEEFVLNLDNNEEIGELFKALFAFAKRGEEAKFKGGLKMAFAIMCQAIEADGRKWEQKCERNTENIRKRWNKNNTNVYERMTTNTNNTDIDIDIDKDIDIDTDTEASHSAEGVVSGFDDFYNAYPRKSSRQKAFRVWQELNPTTETVEKIMKAIEVQRNCEQWKKENGRYIPYPENYLRGRRWEDVTAVPEEESTSESDVQKTTLGRGGGHTYF